MAIYMKYGSIDGAVTTAGWEKWIELTSMQWGVGRGIGTAARGAATRESSDPSLSEVTVTKMMDASSPKLLNEAWAGHLDQTVKIVFTTTDKGDTKEFLSYELTNTGISGYSLSSGGDLPSESLSLNFTKIMESYTSLDPSQAGNPEKVAYDLTVMKTS